MVIFTLLAFAIVISMVVGQFRIAKEALQERKAGIGRFTYSIDEAPLSFWGVLILEWVGLIIVFAYLLALIVGVLFP
ncbi:hypothetical protein [Erythrobacter sp. SD-21]|uniref:hypothetical protein n=1 Tax=Erythrobacter sp. SD-21 TaxID=161528 RepID=UPI000153F09E|nr:hypothetical protein [Erythrobacter sp. SD-21]EDL49264.1 hypothetical protein ED21_21329 [Erythrobacter sp. SD-21]